MLYGISTHTSRVGCDGTSLVTYEAQMNFYSHIPCGMWRRNPDSTRIIIKLFLLTHPVWDVTQISCCEHKWYANFYSHIPCGMWLQRLRPTSTQTQNFYSHIPCGMWLADTVSNDGDFNFYSHIPCGMWRPSSYFFDGIFHFYSHIPCGMWRNSSSHDVG